jgi:hypothetical protein
MADFPNMLKGGWKHPYLRNRFVIISKNGVLEFLMIWENQDDLLGIN